MYFNYLYFIIFSTSDMDSEIDLSNDDSSSASESDVEETIELDFGKNISFYCTFLS